MIFALVSTPVKPVAAVFAFMLPSSPSPVAFVSVPDMADTDESWLMSDETADEMRELAEDYASYESGCYAW